MEVVAVLPMGGTVKGVVDTAEMVRDSKGKGDGSMMVKMHMVSGCTVDQPPVVAVVSTGTMAAVQDLGFRARPIILLKVLPDPGIVSEVDIVAVGEGNGHHRHGITHRHHCQL